jgi:hypothetical protein
MSKKTKFVGVVNIVNNSEEAKYVPAGEITGNLDLTDAVGLGPLTATAVKTAPIPGQQPGTSGLRKKTKELHGRELPEQLRAVSLQRCQGVWNQAE